MPSSRKEEQRSASESEEASSSSSTSNASMNRQEAKNWLRPASIAQSPPPPYNSSSDRETDTPCSSPEPRPSSSKLAQRRPRPITAPPAALPMGMRAKSGEYDSQEWQSRTGRCDPIMLKTRYSDPYELERTLLSPVISERTELPTRAHSLRTQPSKLTDSNSSNESDNRSSASAPPTESPVFSTAALNGLNRHLDRLSEASNLKARSAPILRVQVTPAAPQATRSMRALTDYAETSSEQEDALEERQIEPASSTSPTLRRISSRPVQVASLAEEKFNRRISKNAAYINRKYLLEQKDQIMQRLKHCSSPQEEVHLLRSLGELYLSNAVDAQADDNFMPSLKQREAEMAIVWLRRGLDRSNTDVESWYLLARAHEAYAAASDENDKIEHRHHALSAYASALDLCKDPVNRGRVLCSLGVLYCSANSYDYAREAFEKAVGCDERQQRAFLNLGQLWDFHFVKEASTEEERSECLRRAIASYEKVLHLDATNEQARSRLIALGALDPAKDDDVSQATAESLPFDEDASCSSTLAEEPFTPALSVVQEQPEESQQETQQGVAQVSPTDWPEPPHPHSVDVPLPPVKISNVSPPRAPPAQSPAPTIESNRRRTPSVVSRRYSQDFKRLEDMMVAMVHRQDTFEAKVADEQSRITSALEGLEQRLTSRISELISTFAASRRPSVASREEAPEPPRNTTAHPQAVPTPSLATLMDRLGGAATFSADSIQLANMATSPDFMRNMVQVVGVLTIYAEMYRSSRASG